ncbi:MAG TPA: hypothetical protein DD635_00095 [Flavobacteriales bacterium]|nr:hypothetical protein [Flavobacteriales bacterium]|tara:strand:+ start:18521 stop:19174 length:654 start_codon:yes stop_codon:yes gene_type:complete
MADFTVIFKSLAPLAAAGFGKFDAATVAKWATTQVRFPNRKVSDLSPIRQMEHWCVDQVLNSVGHGCLRINHNRNGRPEVEGSPNIHISIAHHSIEDGCWAAIALSDVQVGIDVEAERGQLQQIAPRFLSVSERKEIGETPAALAATWAIKECMFKSFGPALDLRQDMEVVWPGLKRACKSGVIGRVHGTEWRYRIEPLRNDAGHTPVWLALGPVLD